MRRLYLTIIVTLFTSMAIMAQKSLSVKEVVNGVFAPKMVGGMRALPDGETYARISQDGKKIVAYNYKDNKQVQVLFDVNNTVGEKISSFDSYILSPDGKKMLIATNRKPIYRRSFTATYYIYNIADRRMRPLSDNGAVQNPIWSNDGNLVAFVRNNNIYLVKLLYDNAESQVTKDGEFNKIINGVPDWVNEEEFSFSNAMAFSADGTQICWIRYDETDVKQYSLQMYKGMKPEMSENSLYPGSYTYKYPKAGELNSKVTAWSFDIKSRQTRQIQLPLDNDGYIARILPTNDPARILLMTFNRHQDHLTIYAANPCSTVCTMILEEKAKSYVKEQVLEGFILTDNYMLMQSDRSGYMGLYLYSPAGILKRSITLPDADITRVHGIDDKTGDVFFEGATPTPKDRQIYVSHANGKMDCLTPRAGQSSAQFSASFKYFLSTWSDADTPYEFAICNNQGKQLSVIEDNKELTQKLTQYNVTKKEFFTFTTSEGVTLEGWMIKPANFSASKKYPVIMHQYSGPGSQQVSNSWGIGSMGQGGAFDYFLAEQGFIVVTVDGRGTGYRGSDFEKCIYMRIGDLESKDQVETALWLGKQSYVDKERIGIWGWSFGGFNTLMSMSEGRPVFRCGVAIASPTNWRFYDSVYTERYMRTPQENADGYAINPINRAEKLHGDLLLVHGLADDNVHPQNSIEYSEALVQADKDFREIYYTNRNHGIRGGNTRNHLLRQVSDWFIEKMK